ncbi:MAG: hypothetical protein MZV70_46780, partial [Desulfobacterales bacterium]|nr:hypothetical protein [Desulfobacterales bacterium]
PPRDRARAPSADGLRHGAVLLAPDLPAFLPGRAHGELPARPCRRIPGMVRAAEDPSVRQPEERRARAPGRCHPLSSHAAGLRRPLPATSRGRWPLPAETRKVGWSGQFVIFGMHSSRAARLPIWPI